MILRLLATYLLLSSASVWGAGDVSWVEKDGLIVEIKFVETEVELTKPLAVEMTLTNTSDKDMRFLGMDGMRLSVHSADGRTYMQTPILKEMTISGFAIPTIKAGESRVEIRSIKLDDLREQNVRIVNIRSGARKVVQLEPGDYKVSVQPSFRALDRDPDVSRNKGMYVGSPGLLQLSFTLNEAE